MAGKRLPIVVVVGLLLASGLLTVSPASAEGPVSGNFPALIITTDTTLASDLAGGIVVGANGITLDCAGHAITGDGSGIGIDLSERSGVTIKNCRVSNFGTGIFLNSSSGDVLTGSTANDNAWAGVLLENSYGNTLTGNTADGNRGARCDIGGSPCGGFHLISSHGNTLEGNAANSNGQLASRGIRGVGSGFSLTSSSGNFLTGNMANDNAEAGFLVEGVSNGNTLKGNTANFNHAGFSLWASGNILSGNMANFNRDGFLLRSHGILTGNTAHGNYAGFQLFHSFHNILVGNIADNNEYGFLLLYYSSYNVFAKNEGCGNGLDFGQPYFAPEEGTHNVFANNVFCTTGRV